jgi:hypothetical protein
MLLVGPPMPDRLRVMTRTKSDNPALQVGGWGVRLTNPPRKKFFLRNLKEMSLDRNLGKDMKQYT